MNAVSAKTREALAGISAGRVDVLAEPLAPGAADVEALDERTVALVKIAALIALDAPPASYAWQVAAAVEAGATGEDILGVLLAVVPQVGGPKTVAAAAEIMLALGLSLPESFE